MHPGFVFHFRRGADFVFQLHAALGRERLVGFGTVDVQGVTGVEQAALENSLAVNGLGQVDHVVDGADERGFQCRVMQVQGGVDIHAIGFPAHGQAAFDRVAPQPADGGQEGFFGFSHALHEIFIVAVQLHIVHII